MTPQKQRNEHLALTIIKNLKRRHIEGFYCATAEEAVKKVSDLIDDGSSVTWGGTMTVRDLGIPQYLKDRGTASPINAARFDIHTPCHTDGVCHNCNSPECICNYVHFLRNSPQGRHVVVLVGESFGY